MQAVLLELIVPLALAVFLGVVLGWYMWRRGRSVITQGEYESLLRQPMLSSNAPTAGEPEPSRQSLAAHPIVDSVARAEAEKLRQEKTDLAVAAGRLSDELATKDRELTQLILDSSALEQDLRLQRERCSEAERSLEHSEIYIRALEAELRLTPTPVTHR